MSSAGPASPPRGPPVDAVRDIWRAGEKLARGYKLYGAGHANVRAFVSELFGKLAAWFEARGRLEVTLTPSDVLLDGEKVLRGESPEKNFAHPMAEAGVNRLAFEPGLEVGELERLFAALQPRAAGQEDDLTTRLWTHGFAHIHWSSDSEIDRADPEDEATASWLRAALVILQQARADGAPRSAKRAPSLAELARDGLASLDAVPVVPKANLTRVAFEQVVAESKADADLTVRALSYLLEPGPSPSEAELELAGEWVAAALEKLASSAEVAQAARLLELLGGGPLEAARAKALAEGAEKLARCCLAAVAEGRASAEATAGALKRLGPGAAPALVEGVATMEAGPARLAMVALLPTFAEAGLLALTGRLPKLPPGPALELLAQVKPIGPLAVDVFDAASSHADGAVASEGARRAADPSTMSPGRAAAALSDSDADRRRAAVAYLRKSKAKASAPALEAVIGGDAFKAFSLEEKTELLAALAELTPEQGLATARRLFTQKSLLGGAAQDETRVAAARALGQLEDPQSREELESIANGRGSAALKEACATAMRQIDIAHQRRFT